MFDGVSRVEEKRTVFTVVFLTGIIAFIRKNSKICNTAFALVNLLIVIDTLVKMILSSKNRKGRI